MANGPKVWLSSRAFPHNLAPFLKQLVLLCNLLQLLSSKALPFGGCSRAPVTQSTFEK